MSLMHDLASCRYCLSDVDRREDMKVNISVLDCAIKTELESTKCDHSMTALTKY
jgi:hypothetical protein